MNATVENVLAVIAALPGVYGFVCWIRRSFHARSAARSIREAHPEEWSRLHWLARRSPWAGIEVLITKGLISGPLVEAYRARDEYLEKATWLGLLVSAVLLLVVFMLKYALSGGA